MSLSDYLPNLFSNDEGDDENGSTDLDTEMDPPAETAVIYECRECGLSVSEDTTRCPSCDSTAIAEYPID